LPASETRLEQIAAELERLSREAAEMGEPMLAYLIDMAAAEARAAAAAPPL
jgi:hypothetical protein